jgi:DNA-binding transcriptional MerR regulator/methylmalonyl-CoA mutase cobalamin-binding subunit
MYTIKQAALRSGVNVPLLRAWERRYRVVAPNRTESGYRLYDEDAITRLRAMRALVDGGWSARQAAARVEDAGDEELAELAGLAGPTDEAARDRSSVPSTEPDVDIGVFVAGAAALDGAAIERALDDMFAAGSFERVMEDRVYPALRALGEAWSRGEVDVAGEHAASAAAVRRLSMAFEAAATADVPDPRPVLVGLPPGARHEAAALAFATALRRAGLAVLYLGPDVPVASWVTAAARTDARAVALGAAMTDDVAAADAVVTALRDARDDLVVAVGGRRSTLVGNGGVIRLPDRLGEAVATLRAALG